MLKGEGVDEGVALVRAASARGVRAMALWLQALPRGSPHAARSSAAKEDRRRRHSRRLSTWLRKAKIYVGEAEVKRRS